MDLQKRTWAEISLKNIEHNYNTIRNTLPDGCKFLGVVKADAYGHGAVRVSQLLEKIGADYLAVSCLDEALELRNAGIKMPILILGHTPPEYTDILIERGITQTVSCLAKAEEYSQKAAENGGTLKIHIKVDSGMGRLGFICDDGHFSYNEHFEEGVHNIVSSCSLPHLDVEGIYTHFAVSDVDGDASRDFTLKQFKLFTDVIKSVEEIGNFHFKIRHCANSGAVVNYKEMALDMVRPGILLYGYGDGGKLGLKPCMSLISTVSTIKYYEEGTSISYGRLYTTPRRTRIGVVPIGYADGLFRCLSDKCSFYSDHGFVPQRGRICMDMCMVDLTDAPDVNLESRIEIFGPNASLEELSTLAGTIPYELLCSVSKRVPRVYID
jgi:alanine racemase